MKLRLHLELAVMKKIQESRHASDDSFIDNADISSEESEEVVPVPKKTQGHLIAVGEQKVQNCSLTNKHVAQVDSSCQHFQTQTACHAPCGKATQRSHSDFNVMSKPPFESFGVGEQRNNTTQSIFASD
jgi:hypothetical protein